jgi:SPFH domain / Band 7 family
MGNVISEGFFQNNRIGMAVVGTILLVSAIVIIPNMVENLDASELMVVQSPVKGQLTVFTDPGIKYQGFGKVTKYPRRAQYSFAAIEYSAKSSLDTSKRLRFNDGGHANLSGSVSWEMPLSPAAVINIHKTFGNAEGVEQQAVAKMIDAAVYLAGPLMSSTESSGERRAELVQYINDQAEHGVYVTAARTIMTKDPLTRAEKSVIVTEIIRDDKGQPKRQQASILGEFEIKLMPLSIKALDYDKIVEEQIAERQKATTQVQIALANARRAEQDAITIAKQGEATAAKAKWDQETIKAKEVTLAQQKYEVAKLGALEAEQYKKTQTLMGEGEGARKRLVMQADGALDKKLEAYKEVNRMYAEAISKYQGNWVPSVIMGNGNGQSGNGASAMIDMLTIKAARDLGLDMSMQKQKQQ